MTLRSARDIAREMRRVYASTVHGELDASHAGKLIYMLSQIRGAVEIVGENEPHAMTAQEKAAAIARALVMHYGQNPEARARIEAELQAAEKNPPAETPARLAVEAGTQRPVPSAEGDGKRAAESQGVRAPSGPRVDPRASAATARPESPWVENYKTDLPDPR